MKAGVSMASALDRLYVSVSVSESEALDAQVVSVSVAWKRQQCVSLEATTACGHWLLLLIILVLYFVSVVNNAILLDYAIAPTRFFGTTALAQFSNLQLPLLAVLFKPILLME